MKTKSVMIIRVVNRIVSAAALLALSASCATAQTTQQGIRPGDLKFTARRGGIDERG